MYNHFKKSNDYYRLPQNIFPKCTSAQLIRLRKDISTVEDDTNYWAQLYLKTFDIDWDNIRNPIEVSTKLQSLLGWVKDTLPSDFAEDLTALIRYCLLVNSLLLNKLDVPLFRQYVDRPKSCISDYLREFTNAFAYKRQFANYWENSLNLPTRLCKYDASTLYREYISHVMRSGEEQSWLTKYFEHKYLQRTSIIVDLESGKEVKDLNTYFSESELISLRDQKYLKLEEHNKKKFEEVEEVKISLKIKNISQLTIKIFEVNTQSYYRKYKSQFREDLDLDGLIPASSKTLNLDALNPLSTIRKTFDFPEIQQKSRGIFIVEFVGGGLSSRAVIRKGGLTLISQPIAKGLIFNVVNERKEICLGDTVGILVGGQYYKPDDKGGILIPYAMKPLNEQAVVIYKEFADIVPVSVPNENYAFLTSLIFNEESIVAGNVAKLILHPKLIFNGRAISIDYVKNPRVIINSTNEANVKSSVVFSDVKYSYEEDTVINYLVPPKIKQIEVRAEGTIKLVDGTEVNVSTQEYIKVSKKAGTDLFFNIYLQKLQDQYQLKLLGKNGEGLAGKVLIVKCTGKAFSGGYFNPIELMTDANGVIQLGKLSDVTRLEVSFNNSGLSTSSWNINEVSQEFHIQDSYHICLGEELLLPALNTDPSRVKHQLAKHSTKTRLLLEDKFDSFSRSGTSYVFKFTEPGLYIFKYLEIGQQVEILVIQGERWSYSNSFIAEKNQLTKMISDLSFMKVEYSKIEQNRLKFKLQSNNSSKLKVHILGFNFYSKYFGNLHQTSRKMCPHYARETFGFPYTENSFMSEKLLGDEINYVLNRKLKTSYLGNTLEKPPVVLKRHFNRDTNPDQEVLQTGQDFQNRNMAENKAAFMKADKAKLSMPPPRTFEIERISDFLATDGLVLTNVKPNAEGEFDIEIPDVKQLSTLRVIATDVMSNLSFDVSLPASSYKTTDVRLQISKKTGLIYGASRFAQVAKESGSITLADANNTDTVVVDNVETIFSLLKVLSQYSNKSNALTIDKWSFLTKWDSLTFKEKMKHYDEFSGHELHIFIYLRDQEFFNKFIKKFIASKSKFDTIDEILLGKEARIRELISFRYFSSLKPVELALIATGLLI